MRNDKLSVQLLTHRLRVSSQRKKPSLVLGFFRCRGFSGEATERKNAHRRLRISQREICVSKWLTPHVSRVLLREIAGDFSSGHESTIPHQKKAHICLPDKCVLFSTKFALRASEIASLWNICSANVKYSLTRMWANFISHCDEGAIFHNFRKEIISHSAHAEYFIWEMNEFMI